MSAEPFPRPTIQKQLHLTLHLAKADPLVNDKSFNLSANKESNDKLQNSLRKTKDLIFRAAVRVRQPEKRDEKSGV